MLRLLHADRASFAEFARDRRFHLVEQQRRVERARDRGAPPDVDPDAWVAMLDCVLVTISADIEVVGHVEEYLAAC